MTAAVAGALAARLRDLEVAHERSSSFVRGGRAVAGEVPVDPGAGAEAARDLLLRLCRTLGAAANVEVLEALAGGDRGDGELADLTGHGPVALWEQVNDLIQVGLARRDLTGGRVGLTEAGAVLASTGRELLEAVAARWDAARTTPARGAP